MLLLLPCYLMAMHLPCRQQQWRQLGRVVAGAAGNVRGAEGGAGAGKFLLLFMMTPLLLLMLS
jgi:hypothetical protein